MSSGTQVDLDWAGMDSGAAPDVAGNAAGGARGVDGLPGAASAAGTSRMTDEEILGMDSVGQTLLSVPDRAAVDAATSGRVGTRGEGASAEQGQAGVPVLLEMPSWMGADPKFAEEARELWQEHQAFRAAFSSAEEARAMKELLPGGAQEVVALRQAVQEIDSLRQVAAEVDSLRAVAAEAELLRQSAASMREAAQSVDRIDAAIFSGDARAQSEVVAEIARANPAAFRAMFAEAAKVMAGMGEAGGRWQGVGDRGGEHQAGGTRQEAGSNLSERQNSVQEQTYGVNAGPALRKTGEGLIA